MYLLLILLYSFRLIVLLHYLPISVKISGNRINCVAFIVRSARSTSQWESPIKLLQLWQRSGHAQAGLIIREQDAVYFVMAFGFCAISALESRRFFAQLSAKFSECKPRHRIVTDFRSLGVLCIKFSISHVLARKCDAD